MRRALVLFVAVVVLGISTVAHAAIISQNFDNTLAFPLGYQFNSTVTGLGNSATTDGLWRLGPLGGGAGGYPEIVNDQAHSGAQSVLTLRPTGVVTSQFQGYTTMAGTPINSGVVETTSWFRRSNGGDSTFYLANHDDFAADNNAVVGGLLFYDGYSSNSLHYKPVAGGWSSAIDGVTIPVDSWFGLRMVVDMDNDTYDVWYNDGGGWDEVASDVGVPAAGNGNINCVLMMPAANPDCKVWIDDVELRVVPEPGTSMLLITGLIGLLCYAWRKRK